MMPALVRQQTIMHVEAAPNPAHSDKTRKVRSATSTSVPDIMGSKPFSQARAIADTPISAAEKVKVIPSH
ncbi:hypothetical protein GCM10007868_29570 [Gluconobacter frateurii]|uniref:Uncharacterized protein n=1 Tax=Gluconobacter frateurii NRIC 0228 TaxID=1307946 RepID=A0ABQ0Q965_9PROT|nr:hypothetical protein AA0228_0756 [Gluconobacter frateurii NRIC 0228]GLP91882.1 hypothetical protein GCM10007868_29570 [Gluconobacter frateurii]